MRINIILDKQLTKRGISQHELSRMTGIRQPTINDMSNNKTKYLPLDNLAKICQSLECEITDIIELKEEPAE